MRRKILLLSLLLLLAGGLVFFGYTSIGVNRVPWFAGRALQQADRFTLYSIEPELRIPYPESVERLHRHPVLGSVEITSADTRTRIVQAIRHGVANWSGERFICFDPRHAVRVISGSTTYDLLICYECQRIYIYRGATCISSLGLTDPPETFNEVLRRQTCHCRGRR